MKGFRTVDHVVTPKTLLHKYHGKNQNLSC